MQRTALMLRFYTHLHAPCGSLNATPIRRRLRIRDADRYQTRCLRKNAKVRSQDRLAAASTYLGVELL